MLAAGHWPFPSRHRCPTSSWHSWYWSIERRRIGWMSASREVVLGCWVLRGGGRVVDVLRIASTHICQQVSACSRWESIGAEESKRNTQNIQLQSFHYCRTQAVRFDEYQTEQVTVTTVRCLYRRTALLQVLSLRSRRCIAMRLEPEQQVNSHLSLSVTKSLAPLRLHSMALSLPSLRDTLHPPVVVSRPVCA